MPGWRPPLVGGCCPDKIPSQSKWTVSEQVPGMTGVKSKEVSGPIIIVIISTS